jgi:hypothetical protein
MTRTELEAGIRRIGRARQEAVDHDLSGGAAHKPSKADEAAARYWVGLNQLAARAKQEGLT